MLKLPRLLHILTRAVHLAAVYTGVRALVNRFCSFTCSRPEVASKLDSTTLDVPGLGPWRLRVHSRPSPAGSPHPGSWGILSARLVHPPMRPLLYRYLCLTGHFGCGHMEMVFREQRGALHLYAVRNLARSNAARMGWRTLASQLHPRSEAAQHRFAATVVRKFERMGLRVRVPSGPECVALSVTPVLLPPRSRQRALGVLTRRSDRLRRRVALGA